MPHLKIRGVEKQLIVNNSEEMIDTLSKIIKCERDWLTLEHTNTEYIFDGKISRDGYAFVEVYWFEREKEIKKAVAEYLTKTIKMLNNNKDCCIIFFPLKEENYCDNGEFF